MKNIFTFFLIVGVIVLLLFPLQKNSTDTYDSLGTRILNAISGSSFKAPDVLSMAGDLVEFTVAPNSSLAGITDASGILKGGYFFEGNARGMFLSANKKVLKTFPVTATANWMTSGGVPFTMNIDTSDVPAGNGYIRIANDNPSGDPANDKHIDIPVVFQ